MNVNNNSFCHILLTIVNGDKKLEFVFFGWKCSNFSTILYICVGEQGEKTMIGYGLDTFLMV